MITPFCGFLICIYHSKSIWIIEYINSNGLPARKKGLDPGTVPTFIIGISIFRYKEDNPMKLKKTAKNIALLGLAGSLAIMPVFPTLAAGWSQSNGKTYYYQPDGSLTTGLAVVDGNYYYFLSDGSMVTGWLKLDGEYYYMQENGMLTTGWRQIDGDWYYLRPDSGKCVLNSAIEIDGYWYFFKSDGKKLTGWLKKNGAFYYLDPAGDGRMVAGISKNIDGANYTFGPDGICTSTGSVNNYYDSDNAGAQASGQSSSQSSDSSGSRVVSSGNSLASKGPGVSNY